MNMPEKQEAVNSLFNAYLDRRYCGCIKGFHLSIHEFDLSIYSATFAAVELNVHVKILPLKATVLINLVPLRFS